MSEIFSPSCFGDSKAIPETDMAAWRAITSLFFCVMKNNSVFSLLRRLERFSQRLSVTGTCIFIRNKPTRKAFQQTVWIFVGILGNLYNPAVLFIMVPYPFLTSSFSKRPLLCSFNICRWTRFSKPLCFEDFLEILFMLRVPLGFLCKKKKYL